MRVRTRQDTVRQNKLTPVRARPEGTRRDPTKQDFAKKFCGAGRGVPAAGGRAGGSCSGTCPATPPGRSKGSERKPKRGKGAQSEAREAPVYGGELGGESPRLRASQGSAPAGAIGRRGAGASPVRGRKSPSTAASLEERASAFGPARDQRQPARWGGGEQEPARFGEGRARLRRRARRRGPAP